MLIGAMYRVASAQSAPAQVATLADCDAGFLARPASYQSARCYYEVGQRLGHKEAAARRLDTLRRRHPDNHWLTLTRGHLEWSRAPDAALEFYARAAAGFAGSGQTEGEVMARTSRRALLFAQGRSAEAAREVALASTAAKASANAMAMTRATILEARHRIDTGRDVGAAYRALKGVMSAQRADWPYLLRRQVWFAASAVSFRMGRFAEAMQLSRQLAALASAAGDAVTSAIARYDIANTFMAQMEEMPRPSARERALSLARAALQAAVQARYLPIQVSSHRALGELLSFDKATANQARHHLDQCVRLATEMQRTLDLGHCLWTLGQFVRESDGQKARHYVDRALAIAAAADNPWSMVFAWRQRMRLVWQVDPGVRAIEDSQLALAAIERLRDAQGDELGRSRVFSAWTRDYAWLVGRILSSARSEDDRAMAFAISEQMRARVLRERLLAADIIPALPAQLRERKKALTARIAALQRARLPEPAGRAAAAEKDTPLARYQLELADIAARQFGNARTTKLPLAAIQSHLAATQALLLFQIAPEKDLFQRFAGGSWVMVITADRINAVPVPSDPFALDNSVAVFNGLFARRDGSEQRPSVALFNTLLRPALQRVSPQVDELLIVPDGALHKLPFAALRAAPGEPPLGTRYAISRLPSASLWAMWRRRPVPRATRSAFIVADPRIPAQPTAETVRQFRSLAQVEQLPHARAEGRRVAARLGATSDLLTAAQASEKAVKNALLASFAAVHFAAHAVVDERNPERSAIVLAPGDAAQDGLLQPREIGALQLDGRLVVLSACHTATGVQVRGEGVLGIARAFFQAGAHTVVGSLWPLRDDDAAALIDALYRHLDDGMTVAGAMRAARAERLAAGAPAAEWAGLVVLGDGGLQPFSGRSLRHRAGIVAIAIALAIALFCWLARRRRAQSIDHS